MSDTPEMTNKMKANCIGEFSWKEDAPYYDEFGEMHEFEAIREVPWDLCKDIYKMMYKYSPLPEQIQTLQAKLQKAEERVRELEDFLKGGDISLNSIREILNTK